MSNFDVSARTIYLTRHGSHAYGLATPTSDIDVKGVCVAPREHYLGYLHNFEQAESKDPYDSVIYSLPKFVRLAADCNPNIIEVLFSDAEDHIFMDDFGRKLLDIRDEFISKKARHTFSGYAHAQLKRIEGHRSWLLNPPEKEPIRSDFGLPERTVIPADQIDAARSLVVKQLEKWNFENMQDFSPDQRIFIQSVIEDIATEIKVNSDDKWNAAARSVGLDDNFIEILDRERRYKAARNNWDSYRKWEKERNPARAEQERKYGYDTKHASHLIRLMRMCKEILQGKGVIVKRPDRDELLAIKLHGAMRYEDLIAEARRLDEECNELYKTSALKHSPDRNKIDTLVIEMTDEYLRKNG